MSKKEWVESVFNVLVLVGMFPFIIWYFGFVGGVW